MSSVVTEAAPISVQAVFTSPKYSDLTVLCGRDKYLLHRAIVCPRSDFFDAACDGAFKEASTGTVTLDGDDPQTVNRMLIYLYTNDYPEGAIPPDQQPDRATSTRQGPPPSYEASKLPHLRGPSQPTSATSAGLIPSKVATPAESTSSASPMMSNVLVYAIADRYHLLGLKSLAKDRVHALVKKSSAYTKTADFPEVAKVVFDSTPAADCGLRDIIIDLCSSSMDEIIKDGDTATTDTIQDIGSLSFGIMLKTREANKLTLKQAKSSEAIIDGDPAYCKAENCRHFEGMSRLEKEMKQAIADKSTAKIGLEAALRQKESAVAQYKQLADERDVAHNEWKKVLIAHELAVSQKESAMNQRDQVIVERDAALNRACNCFTRLDSFLTESREWTECRNCGLSFNAWLERVGPDDSDLTVQLRCWDCHCRHDLGAGVHKSVQ